MSRAPTQEQLARWGRAWDELRKSDAHYAPDVLELLDMLYGQWQTSSFFRKLEHDHKAETSRKGGQATPLAAVHQLAEKLYRENPKQKKSDVAHDVVEMANAHPEEFGLPPGVTVEFSTVYRRLQKNTKK